MLSKFATYHGDGERLDAFDIQDAVLPGDDTLHVDVQLVPDGQDGLVVLLVPVGGGRSFVNPSEQIRNLLGFLLTLTCWPG